MPREHYQQTVFDEHDHLASMMFLLVVTSLLQSFLFSFTQQYPNASVSRQATFRIMATFRSVWAGIQVVDLKIIARKGLSKFGNSLVSTKDSSFTCLDGGMHKESDNLQ